MRRNPAFAIAAIASLAIGIGANTAIFGVVDALLIRPLPVAESGQLAYITPIRPCRRREATARGHTLFASGICSVSKCVAGSAHVARNDDPGEPDAIECRGRRR